MPGNHCDSSGDFYPLSTDLERIRVAISPGLCDFKSLQFRFASRASKIRKRPLTWIRPFSRVSSEFRDSRDSSSEKTPFVMTPFSRPDCSFGGFSLLFFKRKKRGLTQWHCRTYLGMRCNRTLVHTDVWSGFCSRTRTLKVAEISRKSWKRAFLFSVPNSG